MHLQNKRIIVTGGTGFLGSHVADELESRGCEQVFRIGSQDYDLRNPIDIEQLYTDQDPDIVINTAGAVGGIGFMADKPGEAFYDNAVLGIEPMEKAHQHGVEKFVSIGSVCGYPEDAPVPFREDDFWDGYPADSHAPYGIAKKIPLVQSQAYREQYDFNSIYLLPVNLYGPRDNFDPRTSHVIPAIIRKVDQAIRSDDESIVAWGTGDPTREFLYIEDAADGVVEATKKYDGSAPVNLGSGEEISIEQLTTKIADKMEFDGHIEWDTSKPEGTPRRSLDVSRAKEKFGWTASVDFDEGLEKTIEWFYENQSKIVE